MRKRQIRRTLKLEKETVRTLEGGDLESVAGGVANTANGRWCSSVDMSHCRPCASLLPNCTGYGCVG